MPRVTNFTDLVGDGGVLIGDDGVLEYIRDFNTSTYATNGGNACLMLMAQGLTEPGSSAEVLVNDIPVGFIHSSHADARPDRVSQIINVGTEVLNAGDNRLRIKAAVLSGGGSGNEHDDFEVSDVMLFYQVDV
jgi:hypothetical protein